MAHCGVAAAVPAQPAGTGSTSRQAKSHPPPRQTKPAAQLAPPRLQSLPGRQTKEEEERRQIIRRGREDAPQ